MEPPKYPLKLMELLKRENLLYSIGGWFLDVGPEFEYKQNPVATGFGGFFKLDTLLGTIGSGLLVDRYGSSRIVGKLEKDNMIFLKYYRDESKAPLKYQFFRQGDSLEGIWIRHPPLPEGKELYAKARITLIEAGAWDILGASTGKLVNPSFIGMEDCFIEDKTHISDTFE